MASKISKVYEFEWKIHSFRKELLDELKFAKCFLSNDFQIFIGTNNETKWHFKLYVKDSGLSIYLQKEKVDYDDFTVIFGINTCKSDDPAKFEYSSEHKSSVYKNSRGWSDFLKTEEVFNDPQKYLRNDTLTLSLKVELVQEIKESDCTEFSPKANPILPKFEEYFDTKLFSDFTFTCSDGVEIPVHRLVLAMNSDVMKSKFDTTMDETKAIKGNIKDIDGETMTEVLRFLYTRKVNNINELAAKLLHSAEKYELDNLKKHCVELMVKSLNVENALEYFLLADRFHAKYLEQCSAMFIKSNYKALCDIKNDWNKLEVKHWTILLEYFRRNDNYIQVFESTLKKEAISNFSFDSFIRT